MSVHKKFSPIGPAVWPAIRNIYMTILFYYIDNIVFLTISVSLFVALYRQEMRKSLLHRNRKLKLKVQRNKNIEK